MRHFFKAITGKQVFQRNAQGAIRALEPSQAFHVGRRLHAQCASLSLLSSWRFVTLGTYGHWKLPHQKASSKIVRKFFTFPLTIDLQLVHLLIPTEFPSIFIKQRTLLLTKSVFLRWLDMVDKCFVAYIPILDHSSQAKALPLSPVHENTTLYSDSPLY